MKLYGIVKSDRKLPLQEVTNIFNENRPRTLSDRTVQRNLYETKYHKCVVKQTSGRCLKRVIVGPFNPALCKAAIAFFSDKDS
jgi:hypothetical protein